MARYTLARLAQAALALVAITVITFALMQAVPGGPFDAPGGDRPATPQAVAAQERYYGLQDPWPEQLGRLLGRLAQGDLGPSLIQDGRSVAAIVREGMGPSLILGSMAFLLVLGIGLPLGLVAALRARERVDYAATGLATVLGAVPAFVLAFLLLLVFAVWLDLAPVRLGRDFGDRWETLPHGVLPALALGAPGAALLARLTRGALLDVLGSDYIRTARAKGLAPGAVLLRHALRNAAIPLLTALGPILAVLVTGSIVIESIFGLPGVGTALITAINQRDYGVILGVTLFYAAVVLLLNLAVDLTYPLVDARLRARTTPRGGRSW